MDRIQITLTVEEAKEVIALGILKHPIFVNSLKKGKILFKGGTTVSKITEKLVGIPLRICGRITSRGTVSSLNIVNEPHSIILNNGNWIDVDDIIDEEIQNFTEDDLIVCSANAFDSNGRAALMVGDLGGGNVGKSISLWYSEGASVIIPVGIEKMIPGDLDKIIYRSGRRTKYFSWGMSVGLIPLLGEIFTEVDAVKALANVDCFAIGAGGLGEAQGSTTLEICGEKSELNIIIDILIKIKNSDTDISGVKDSLVECKAICSNCAGHLGCGYKSGLL